MRAVWDVSGSGRSVVLLHGFTGCRETWGTASELLSKRFRVVRVDLPGHGSAPIPEAGEGFREAVAAIGDVITAACGGSPAVVGYSQGARLALGLAVESPHLVGGLVLESSSAGLPSTAEREQRRVEDERWARVLEDRGISEFVDQWEEVAVLSGLKQLPAAERERLRALRLAQRPKGLAAALRSFGLGAQPDYGPRLTEVACPTRIVTGELDRRFTAGGAELGARIPGAQHRVIANSGHTPHLEAPSAWAEALIPFLDSLSTEQPRRTA